MKQEKNKQTETSRFVRLLAVIILCLCTTQLAFAQTFNVDGIYYKKNSDGISVSVTKNSSGYSGVISIPDNVTYESKTYSVTSIEDYAFFYCSNLDSLKLGNSIKTIGERAFFGCTNLKGTLIIPDSVTDIGNDAFSGSNLDSLKLGKSLKTIGDATFQQCGNLKGTLNIPDSVTSIGARAFYNCSKLDSLKLGKSIKTIEEYAFYECTNLKGTLSIPDSVTNIGLRAFQECSKLDSLKFGKSIKTIDEYAFYECTNLKGTLSIPDSVTSIGNSAFENCSKLDSLKLGKSIKTIGNYAFYKCSNLKGELIIPDSVTSIGKFAFYQCKKLDSLKLGKSIKTIGNEVFNQCTNIKSIISEASIPPTLGTSAFYSIDKSTCQIQVPYTSVDAYKTANGWKDFTNISAILPAKDANGVYQIGDMNELLAFADIINGTSTTAAEPTANAVLTADIDMDGMSLRIGNNETYSYQGVFDGQGHTISNYVVRTENAYDNGLFGYVKNGTVKNVKASARLILDRSSDTNSATLSNDGHAHTAFIGYVIGGTVENCEVTATITTEGTAKYVRVAAVVGGAKNATIRNCVAKGTMTNEGYPHIHFESCGAIVGICQGTTVENCVNEMQFDIYLNNMSASKGTIVSFGGLIGIAESNSTVTGCVNKGTINITGVTPEGSDAYGKAQYVGGVVGNGGSLDIIKCVNLANITETDVQNDQMAGIVGYLQRGAVFSIENCANVGNLTCTFINKDAITSGGVGGILGYFNAGDATNRQVFVNNCYNIGDINSATNNRCSLIGFINGANDNLLGKEFINYYVPQEISAGTSLTNMTYKSVTADEVRNGALCYLLNGGTTDGTQVWYQALAETGGDEYPVLTNNDNNTVYAEYSHGSTTALYTNNMTLHAAPYDATAQEELGGNHDKSYVAGEYTWTDGGAELPSVSGTFTCSVCGVHGTPTLTMEIDSTLSTPASCYATGTDHYVATFSFSGTAFKASYDKATPMIDHDMTGNIKFDYDEWVYMYKCQREGCTHHLCYADEEGTIPATKQENGEYIVPSMTLADATKYTSMAVFKVSNLTYTRSFSHDKWMAVYLPFNFDCSQLPDEYEMANINNFHEYEQTDGTYKTVLEIKRVVNGGIIPANTPCLIRRKQAPESAITENFSFLDAKFHCASERNINCSSVTRMYYFCGIYTEKTEFNNYEYADWIDYVLNQGVIYKAQNNTVLKPQRWYLSITDRTGGGGIGVNAINIHVIGDGEATGIDEIFVSTDSADAADKEGIYDLQGRKMQSEPTKGVYIKNGKKYIK